MLRSYPADSPQAAGRILALALVSDGNVSRAEIDRLDQLDAVGRLGLGAEQWRTVLRELCEDLMTGSGLAWNGGAQVDPATLLSLLAEVRDPALRETVIDLCVAAVEADEQVSDGEEALLVAVVEHWGMQPRMLERMVA